MSELENLRKHVHALQQERMLNDTLESRKVGELLKRYIAALSHLAVETSAVRGSQGYSEVRGGSSDAGMPTPTVKWARALMKKHERWLLRQIDELENWLEHPRPTGDVKKSCVACGRGLPRGAQYCPSCGKEKR